MFIAEDFNQFKALFINKMQAMLSDDELGAFILVLANSLQDDTSRERLMEALKQKGSALEQGYHQCSLKATDDDLAVFRQLLGQDIRALPLWQTRQSGGWEITLNVLRALRPTRSSAQILTSIRQTFDADRFHFNKAFLKPEILWQAIYRGVSLKVLYNKFPFSHYHLLIVIAAEKNQPQYLTRMAHDFIFELAQDVVKNIPGFAIGYNSLAAGASVNHLHCQGFVRAAPLPVEKTQWSHNGGNRDYPVNCLTADTRAQSWQLIERCQQANQPFNCLFRNGKVYLLPRVFQGAVALPAWLKGCGWLDLCGVITVSDKQVFDVINESAITQGLSLLEME